MNQFEILKTARKKKRITIRDFRYWDLQELVSAGLLDKVYSKSRTGRGDGWPSYKLSKKGFKALEKNLAYMAEQAQKV
jgi:hypothetical protein